MKVKKIFDYAFHPRKCMAYIQNRKLHSSYGKKMDDEKYIKRMFKLEMGYELDLENPKTFNEKLQWLKLYNRNPEYTVMVDKYLSKQYVADRIGEEYVVPLYGVWDSFDEIDFDSLPEKFVLKTTQDCGGVVVCTDKNKIDKKKTKEFLEKHLRREYFYHCREWPYKDVKPRIIAEKFLKDEENAILPVYKIMCFDGEPKIIQTIQNDKQPNESIDYFDTDWNILEIRQNYPNSPVPISRPRKLEEMLCVAKKLSGKTPFIRIDLYSVNGEIYFSEFTFFSDAGFAAFTPREWDNKLGEWIVLPE